MANALDLFVVPLHRRDGQDQAYLPGVHILAAPRRAARGRAGERLILQLSLPPEMALSAEQQHHLLNELAAGYFRTSGAVTSALRDQIERLNAYFLQLNQQGQPAAARLSAVSVREDRATLAQCGPLQAFLLNGEIQHLYDPQGAGRGLGLGSVTQIRFYQYELAAGECQLLVPDLPQGWNEKTLSNVSGQKLSTLRRRFLSEAGPNLQAVMIVAQPGEGKLALMSSFEPEQPAAKPAAPAAKPAQPAPQAAQAWESIEVPAQTKPEPPQTEPTPEVELPVETASYSPPDAEQEPSGFQDALSAISEQLAAFWVRVSPFLRKALIRLLPEDPVFNLPRQTMAIIAIVVPLAVVVLVSVVYLQFGRGQLYTNYLAQAQSAAAAAEARQDPGEVRQAWEVAVYFAEKAVAYQQDQEEATQLLAQAREALDDLDGITRMDFQPALFESLPLNANITKIAATRSDLFLLDSTTGSVLHAFAASGGFRLDDEFYCEPGPYGGDIVSNLIDLAPLARGNDLGADVLAMDANGNVIYCTEGERPLSVQLIAPDINWGEPNAIAVEDGNLYILDPLSNAVWVYSGEEQSYVGAPRFFFAAHVPSLQFMQDMALEGETLYLLDQDGQLVVCDYGEDLTEDPTICTDPATYTDTRPGREPGARVADTTFFQIQLTDPPEASVFLFDPIVPAVYQFSNRLNFVRQFRGGNSLPAELATAFAISPNRAIFIAFANELYYGFIP
jgi:hypothetical protein